MLSSGKCAAKSLHRMQSGNTQWYTIQPTVQNPLKKDSSEYTNGKNDVTAMRDTLWNSHGGRTHQVQTETSRYFRHAGQFFPPLILQKRLHLNSHHAVFWPRQAPRRSLHSSINGCMYNGTCVGELCNGPWDAVLGYFLSILAPEWWERHGAECKRVAECDARAEGREGKHVRRPLMRLLHWFISRADVCSPRMCEIYWLGCGSSPCWGPI